MANVLVKFGNGKMRDFFDRRCDLSGVLLSEYMSGLELASDAEIRKALRTAANRKS